MLVLCWFTLWTSSRFLHSYILLISLEIFSFSLTIILDSIAFHFHYRLSDGTIVPDAWYKVLAWRENGDLQAEYIYTKHEDKNDVSLILQHN